MSNLKKKFSGIRISTKTKILLIVLCVIALYFVPYVIRGQYWGRIINQAIVNMLVVLGLNLLSGYLGLLNVGASGMVAVGAYTAALLAIPHKGLVKDGPYLQLVCGLQAAQVRRAMDRELEQCAAV